MYTTKKATKVSAYRYGGDRFAAVSMISQIRCKINSRETAAVYKADYLKSFTQAYIDFMASRKNFPTKNDKLIKFMDNQSDVEGFEWAFTAQFYDPIAVIDIYEINFEEQYIVPHFISDNDGYRELVLSVIESEAEKFEIKLNDESESLPGTQICSLSIKLDIDSLLSDAEKQSLSDEAMVISQQSVFTL